MNNPHVTEKLPLWVGGDLSSQEMVAVQAHLDVCPACMAEAKEYTDSLSWTRKPHELPFSSGERANLRKSVMAEIHKSRKTNLRRTMPWMLAAASITAVISFYNRPQESSVQEVLRASRQPDTEVIVQKTSSTQQNTQELQPLIKTAVPRPARRSSNSYHAIIQSEDLEHDSSLTHIELHTDDPSIKMFWVPTPAYMQAQIN